MPLLVVLLCFCFYCSKASAQVVTVPQTQNTTDLLDPSAQNWTGNYGTGYWGGSRIPNTTNPSLPNRLPNDSGFIWGGEDEIISTTIAINTALTQAGIQVNGFTYKWRVKNGNANIYTQQPGIDDFEITVEILDANGNTYQTYSYDYSHSHNWTTHSGSETFPDQFLPPSYFSDINILAQGSDSASWSGRYGPEFNVAQSEFTLTFSTNPCHNNALYDPQCPGYATALFNQQCTQNPLFDPTCQGYAAAYLAQQCSANPLHDPSCPGYATAYYNQQCQNNPLHDQNCPGYATAYFNQQCSLNALHDQNCPGYATAYFNQQCSLNALHDPQCPGYATAYLNQQCSLNPLYDKSCPGYATAYLNSQCALDPLYDKTCTGYKEAKCNVDPLYDTTCIGYDVAYFNQQCSFDPQYDENCIGYIEPVQIVDDGIDINPIADILDTDVTTNFAENTGVQIEGLPTPQFFEPIIEVPVEEVQIQNVEVVQNDITAMEDSIQRELDELESLSGNMNMADNIEAELSQLESSANNGSTNQEDNIEKELASLEEEADADDPRGDQIKENQKEESDEDAEVEDEKAKKKDNKNKESQATPGQKDGSIGGKTNQEDDIEKEIAQLKKETKEKPKAEKKELSRNDKMRMLIAMKAIELTKKIEKAVSIEQQMLVQRQLLALISFVPGFDYNEKENMDLANFYPPKPTVDHHFSRWFLNDPKFGAMEDLQYNLK